MVAILLTKQIISLFLMMFFGWLIVKKGILQSSDAKILSILIVYILLPCTIINAFQIKFTADTAGNFLLAVGSALIIHVVLFAYVFMGDKLLHLNNVEKASIIYSNAGNLIIPLVTAILGEEWVIYASAFMVVQLFIIWTHGKSLMEGKKGMDLKAIFSNVNLIACVVGLSLFLLRIQLPEVVQATVKSLGSTVGAISMLMLGMILAGLDIKTMAKDKRVWLISFVKMIVTPLIVVLIMKYSGYARLSAQGETIVFISLLATMTPTATTITQMAQLYEQNVGQATAINTITTLMCIATMPLLTMIYFM